MKHPTKGKKKLSNNSNSKTENLLLPPYSLRDGDLLAVINIHQSEFLSTSGGDDGGGGGIITGEKDKNIFNALYLDRYEDLYLRWMKNEENYEKKTFRAKNMNGGKKKQIVEISLKFGGDLDFSSDEDDEMEDGRGGEEEC
jgi:hypothetical protein